VTEINRWINYGRMDIQVWMEEEIIGLEREKRKDKSFFPASCSLRVCCFVPRLTCTRITKDLVITQFLIHLVIMFF
jgi:hypothetical protein